jgi:putative ABC transport system permease protein
MVRLPALLYFYRKRLRVHAMQELLAGLGIAAGVALVFSVLVANGSVTGSARQILHGITGQARFQLVTREPQGFDWTTAERVRKLPGVAHTSAVLEQRSTLTYGRRRVAIDLVGVDASLPSLGGFAARYFQLGGLVLQRGIVLPGAVGHALGLSARSTHPPHVSLDIRGRSKRIAVSAVLDSSTIGSLSGALLGVVSLGYAQELAGLPNRVSRVLVVPQPGQEQAVRTGLTSIAQGRLTVDSVDAESRALDQATGPIDQSTGLFAAISAFVGVLFAFTAMLLTTPERRRFVADLRIMGFRRARVVQILGFQAVVLGIAASVLGLVAGYVLAMTSQQDPPGYLAFAFPLGVQRVVHLQTILLALVGGVTATCAAAMGPLLDLRRSRPINAVFSERGEPGHAVSPTLRRVLALAALTLTAAASVALVLVPSLTVVGVAAIAVATVLAVPIALAMVLRVADGPASRWRLNALTLAIRALRATSLRSLVLAATGAVAVFGSVAIQGARHNLLDGLYGDYREYVGTADIWIAHPEDDLALQPFDKRDIVRRVTRVAGVASARPYYGGFLDIGQRRVWVIARPSADTSMVPPSQILSGDRTTVNMRLRSGGWITVSRQIADERNVGIGDKLVLPTPTGDVGYRVAATTTNLGWGPGAVVLNSGDYRRAWATDTPSAVEVNLAAGADLQATKRAIRAVLGRSGGLQVETTAHRSRHANAIAREGLARLSQISTLLLIAASLAMAAAMGAGIWQRRVVLAQLRVMGWRPRKLWRALLLETAIVLGTGCLVGASAGVYGHLLLDRWLQLETGYPAPFMATGWQALAICAVVASTALAVTAVPGYVVSRTPPRVGLASRT